MPWVEAFIKYETDLRNNIFWHCRYFWWYYFQILRLGVQKFYLLNKLKDKRTLVNEYFISLYFSILRRNFWKQCFVIRKYMKSNLEIILTQKREVVCIYTLKSSTHKKMILRLLISWPWEGDFPGLSAWAQCN